MIAYSLLFVMNATENNVRAHWQLYGICKNWQFISI